MKKTLFLALLLLSGDAAAPFAIQTISCLYTTTRVSPHYNGRLAECQYHNCGEKMTIRKIPCKMT